MSLILSLAYLFFVGSCLGWLLELWFRNIVKHPDKLVNPGFCTGPYLPIYGFGLCVLYLLASLEKFSLISDPLWNKVVLFIAMAIGMTLVEYVAGLFCLKFLKVRLWDYSDLWGNIQGIICPLFSLAWAVLGAIYYFLIHPYILHGLDWLARNLAFSFFIGVFFGVFAIDVAHSRNLMVRLRAFAQENKVVLRYEGIKDHIRNSQLAARRKYHFFRPFHSERNLQEHLRELLRNLEMQNGGKRQQ